MENSAITDHGIFYHCRKLHQAVCHGLLYILSFIGLYYQLFHFVNFGYKITTL